MAEYNWTFEGAEPSQADTSSASATWVTPGVYTVSFFVTDDSGDSSAVEEVEVTVEETTDPGFYDRDRLVHTRLTVSPLSTVLVREPLRVGTD